MTRRKIDSKPKAKATSVPVTDEEVVCEPVSLAVSAGAEPLPCGQPEVQKTEETAKRGEGGEFIKRGGKLYRS